MAYIILPVLGLSIVGANVVLAKGWFSGESTEEFVTRQKAMFENQAEMLGMNVEDFKAKWAEGKSFSEIAKEQGLSEADLQTKMQEARKAQMQERLKALVDNGVITQAQADQRLQLMETKMENGKGVFGPGGGKFGHGQRGDFLF